MTILDIGYLTLIAAGLLVDHFVVWSAFKKRSQADGRARIRLWGRWMIILWMLVAAGVALWLYNARHWESLRLVSPHGWRLWGSIVLVLGVTLYHARRVITIARSKRIKRVKMGNPQVEKLLPHTRTELAWWIALSVTAGCCEEFIFRGYLIWAFQPQFGLWGAALFSVVVFALPHAYQGLTGMVGAGIYGALLTLVVLISGSLFPAILLHAIIDSGQGVVAWLVMHDMPVGKESTAGKST